jgi:hypothetical protein
MTGSCLVLLILLSVWADETALLMTPALFRSLQAGTRKPDFDCLAAPGGKLTPAEHGFADPYDYHATKSRVTSGGQETPYL